MVKNLPANTGDTRDAGSILRLGRFPGGGNATHSSVCLGNFTDRGAWEQATVHGLTKSQTQLKQLSSHTQMLRGLGRFSDLLHVAWGDRV